MWWRGPDELSEKVSYVNYIIFYEYKFNTA